MKEKLMKIMELCYEISTTSKADIFFNYLPHCNFINVDFYAKGWNEYEKPFHILNCGKINDYNLNYVIVKLEDILAGD